jgi:hypothetical protein
LATKPTPKTLEELKLPLATAMVPMLLAVAIFSLTLLVQTKTPKETITDELFAFLSAACLLGSATIADSAMDSCKASFEDRLRFLGFGYVLFCLAIGTISATIPILYAERAGATPIAHWRYILFFFTGITVAVKPMLYEENYWTVLMFSCYIATIVVSAALFSSR